MSWRAINAVSVVLSAGATGGTWREEGGMRWARVLDTVLAVIGWLLPWGLVVVVALSGQQAARAALFYEIPEEFTNPVRVVFALGLILMLTRLGLAVLITRRVLASLLLATSLLAYTIGLLLTVMGPAADAAVRYPSPGEIFFSTSYLIMAMFLFAETPRIGLPSTPLLVEAGIAAGGTVCLGGVMVASPLADGLPGDGVAALAALFYPMLDLLLLAFLVGETVAGARAPDRRTLTLAVALVLLLIADVSLVSDLTRGSYEFGMLAGALWTSSHLLFVTSVRQPAAAAPRPRTQQRDLNAVSVASGVVAALASLAFLPTGPLRTLLVVPALVTIALAGLRLIASLRLARDAATARQLAQIDDLTGLPNRRAVVARITVLAAQGGLARRALMLVDLEGFTDINDTLGHSVADSVLQQVANQLAQLGGPVELVARLGDDEYALLVKADLPSERWITEFGRQVRAAVRRQIMVGGRELTVDCAVGIALGTRELDADGLLRQADAAIRQAKRFGTPKVLLYRPDSDHNRHRLRRAEELRAAIADEQIVLWYQPKVYAESGTVAGVEALMRWAHPREGLKLPAEVLPIARHHGLMPDLTDAVVRTALADLGHWRDVGTTTRVAVNVAPAELLDGAAVSSLLGALRTNQLTGDRVLVEVTEDSFLADPVRARTAIQELHGYGIGVAIDDYGTGYSALSYLRDLPVVELKIDRTFVEKIDFDRASRMIVETTVRLAHALGMLVVAEGVETAQVADSLRRLDVDLLQGFFISRPMPAAMVPAWIDQRLALDDLGRFRLRRG